MTTPNDAGRQLYEALIAPAERLIPRNSRVILVPDDALNWLNFETLPVYGPFLFMGLFMERLREKRRTTGSKMCAWRLRLR